jgi:hypothetical protein
MGNPACRNVPGDPAAARTLSRTGPEAAAAGCRGSPHRDGRGPGKPHRRSHGHCRRTGFAARRAGADGGVGAGRRGARRVARRGDHHAASRAVGEGLRGSVECRPPAGAGAGGVRPAKLRVVARRNADGLRRQEGVRKESALPAFHGLFRDPGAGRDGRRGDTLLLSRWPVAGIRRGRESPEDGRVGGAAPAGLRKNSFRSRRFRLGRRREHPRSDAARSSSPSRFRAARGFSLRASEDFKQARPTSRCSI